MMWAVENANLAEVWDSGAVFFGAVLVAIVVLAVFGGGKKK